MTIHPTAIIDPAARINESTEIGPYCVIGADVEIGPKSRVGSHSVFAGPTVVGEGNVFGSHCSIGAQPQDLSFKGESTKLVIGERNTFGDFVQITRGSTKAEDQTTQIGSDTYLMAYCHVGHDCHVGNGVVAANGLQLAGHVTVEDKAVFGGLVAIHQHVRVGSLAMISGGSVTAMDIPPYCKVAGYGCAVYGLNAVGLKRAGVDREVIAELRRAYRLIFRSEGAMKDALQTLERDFADNTHAMHWARFFRESKRGVVRERNAK